MNQADITKIVDENMKARRSIRAFLPKDVSKEQILGLLEVAGRAPSGTNTQPWQVYVVTGGKKQAITNDILAALANPELLKEHTEEYAYYPSKWVDPYISRRRKVGFDLYGLLGIGKEDKDKMQAQGARNFQFFDAPVGIFFTIDRVMQQGSWLDYGMFIQNVMLAAKARGLDTCPQAAFTQFHKIIAKHLDLKPEQQLVCGMSLGYADMSKIENTLVTEREPAQNFTTFVEWSLGSIDAIVDNFSMKQFASIAVLISLFITGIQAQAIEVGDQLPLGELRSVQGQIYSENHWKQRHTVVQVWATWCSYCRKQNVHLEQLVQKIPAQQLNVITISIDKTASPVKAYLAKNSYTFPVVMMTPELSKAIGKRRGVPEVYVLNPQGKVVQKDYGLMVDLDFFELARYAEKQK